MFDVIASLAPGASVTYTSTLGIAPDADGVFNLVIVTATNDTNPGNDTASDIDVAVPAPPG